MVWRGKGEGVLWGGGGGGGQGAEDAFGRFARAAVGRGEEVEGVGGVEEGAEAVAGGEGLGPAFGGEFDAVVRGCLVDFAVFWRDGLEVVGILVREMGGGRGTVSF